jgi:hypothetical protein
MAPADTCQRIAEKSSSWCWNAADQTKQVLTAMAANIECYSGDLAANDSKCYSLYFLAAFLE